MNYEQMNNNRVVLAGRIASELMFSHKVQEEGFFESTIEVPRLSDKSDIIPITISERLITDNMLEIGSEIALAGQFRSYNKQEKTRNRLILTVFMREILEDVVPPCNEIELNGYICKPPIYRTTPFNREICDILLAVNRAYNKSDYIPCIAWGRNARFISNCEVGDKVTIIGRIQSRTYQKQLSNGELEIRTAYEVSIGRIMNTNSNIGL